MDQVGKSVPMDATIRSRSVEPPHRELPMHVTAMRDRKSARGRLIDPGGPRRQAVSVSDRPGASGIGSRGELDDPYFVTRR